MSRTVHHVPSRHRILPAFWPLGLPGPWTGNAVAELRYSHAEFSRARREGRRPVPILVVRSFTSYTYSRAMNERRNSPYERRARAALQAFRSAARTHLRAAPAGALSRWAETLDHPPTRHRHRDLWEA
ncbi:hypothetical protein OG866_32910 [Streptomyces sp. NBC_00663]|uniref:hypothetical protein n=1 Tax=Streptomyces sp. NBC_00663 TaxID=2975801 RepID=UPI002E30604C|nr:hypothetical protein [Streptomyces sp. NBC_00663]